MTSDAAPAEPVVLISHRHAEKYRRLLETGLPGAKLIATTDDNAPDLLPQADILVTIGRWLTPEMIAKADRLRWVQCIITGTDHLVGPLRARPDVVVTNARGLHGHQMSETAMMHILNLSRGGRRLARQQQAHSAERFTPMTLEGRRVALIGVGAIAEHLAGICKAFGMHVTGVTSRRMPVPGFDALVPRDAMLRAVAEADCVVALVPLSEDTEKLIGRDVFAAMKPDAFFVNMARGGVVDEDALVEALQGDKIAGAALDVFRDWPLPAESVLWDIDNLMISPFVGGQSDRYEEKVAALFERNFEAFIVGRLQGMTNRIEFSVKAV